MANSSTSDCCFCTSLFAKIQTCWCTSRMTRTGRVPTPRSNKQPLLMSCMCQMKRPSWQRMKLATCTQPRQTPSDACTSISSGTALTQVPSACWLPTLWPWSLTTTTGCLQTHAPHTMLQLKQQTTSLSSQLLTLTTTFSSTDCPSSVESKEPLHRARCAGLQGWLVLPCRGCSNYQ